VLLLATLVYSLQQLMVYPALPILQHDLRTTTVWIAWVATGFLLSSSVCTPVMGRLGDRHGHDRILRLCLTLFLIGSVVCAAAPDVAVLIVGRCVQGVGGGLVAVSLAIVRTWLPPARASVAVGVLSAGFGIGSGLALAISGAIVDHLSWRLLFAVVSGMVVVTLALVSRYVPRSPTTLGARPDWRATVLMSVGLASFLLALTEGAELGWTSTPVIVLFVGSPVILTLWALAELRSPSPMVDVRVLARRAVLLVNVVAFLSGAVSLGALLLVPKFVETPRGLPAGIAAIVGYGFAASGTVAGLILLPGVLMSIFAGYAAGLLGRRFGHRLPLGLGMVLLGGGMTAFALWHSAPWQIVVLMTALLVGVPMTQTAQVNLIIRAVSQVETGAALGVTLVVRQLGAAVGSQLVAVTLTASVVVGAGVPTESSFVRAGALLALLGFVSLLVMPFIGPSSRRDSPVDLSRSETPLRVVT
jgi:MFS family permease